MVSIVKNFTNPGWKAGLVKGILQGRLDLWWHVHAIAVKMN